MKLLVLLIVILQVSCGFSRHSSKALDRSVDSAQKKQTERQERLKKNYETITSEVKKCIAAWEDFESHLREGIPNMKIDEFLDNLEVTLQEQELGVSLDDLQGRGDESTTEIMKAEIDRVRQILKGLLQDVLGDGDFTENLETYLQRLQTCQEGEA